MPLLRLQRVEAVLGSTLENISIEGLEQTLASTQVAEDLDLDFKAEIYGNRDDDKRELAKDVSAMANTQGGIIILGVEERNGIATTISHIAHSEPEILRMRQILASLIAPFIQNVEIKFQGRTTEPSRGVYIITVPKSEWAPHAVRVGESLRYYQRDGAKSRILSENEIAEQYRNRFAAAESQIDKLNNVLREGDYIPTRGSDGLFLVLALVPNTSGSMKIAHETENSLLSWANALRVRTMRHAESGVLPWRQSTTGFRRVTLTDADQETGLADFRKAELHSDGSGYCAEMVSWFNNDQRFWDAIDERVATSLHDQLVFLSEHATNHCGTIGDGILIVTFATRGARNGVRIFRRGESGAEQPRRIVRDFIPSRHTINIEASAQLGGERLSIASRAMADMLQQIGIPGFMGFSQSGKLMTDYFDTSQRNAILRWASSNGIETSTP
ncbi:helix-turn-helix domain-containing protein [Myxococcus eversor]|uniref:AlbA family DNA-binding domain-containing protein n=1 Tax=Myxococcus eversor TaxID=2709661 RepID=UPI0013CF978B|nr:ATP-binding protein [Myxococcus eversor]